MALLDLFHALGDPTRLRIVHLLRAMELAVGEIAQVVGQSQPRVSRHVRILVEAGVVERRKEGNWVFLALSRDESLSPLFALFDKVTPSDGEALWQAADLARLAAVRNDRARAADEYFTQHAEEWDAIRSLHISEGEVEAAMRNALAGEEIGHLLDIGTGTGRMIQLFGPEADRVTAIDRSPDMLRLARAKLPGDAPDRYRLMMGDFTALPLDNAEADTIIVHQVLHYAQAPETVIAEAARVLNNDGRLLIADFAPHQREDLRVRDQHARLGFSDAQMMTWFAAAGLDMISECTLPGGELTVKIWLGRRHMAQVVPIDAGALKGRTA